MVKTRSMDTDPDESMTASEISNNMSMESKEAETMDDSDGSQNGNCSSTEMNEEMENGDQALNYSILQQFYIEYFQLENVKTRIKNLKCAVETLAEAYSCFNVINDRIFNFQNPKTNDAINNVTFDA